MLDANARLDALFEYQILDTPPEPEFDDVVQIAQRACETPVALVSLVAEDRQWFKARVGFHPSETPIAQSVCAHALAVEDLLVIPDLAADPRTRHNTLVTGEPFIRFYAGAVLRTPEGVPIGSLCVIDGKPRPQGLTPDQAETLRALARQTMTLMALRRAMVARDTALVAACEAGRSTAERARISEATSAQLHLDQVRQIHAQEAGGIGTFDIDVASDRCRVSAEFCRIFGLPVAPDYAMAAIEALIVEADRRVATNPETRTDGAAMRAAEYRIHRANDGALRWIGRRADFRTDAIGVVRNMVGVVQDVTDRKLIELRTQALIRLGDALREATATSAIVDIAARTLGETLGADRAAYATIDATAGTFMIECDWTAPNGTSVAGRHPLAAFRRTIDRLADGAPLLIANIPAAGWLHGDLAAYAAMDAKAQIVVPLLERGHLVGLLFAHSATPRTWSVGETDFALSVADRTHAAIAKSRAEAQQQVLNQELSHRLKNTLAMVQAIANQTLRGVDDREAVHALDERIIALSQAHDVLLEQSWASARIATVIEKVLALHARDDRVAVTGPNLTLGPKATLSLSLLLHELATNALKYGALSAKAGRVALDWRVTKESREPTLVLTWIETGGPPASPPTRRGFGSRLIGMGLAGSGNAKLDYTPDGLRAEFHAPLRVISET